MESQRGGPLSQYGWMDRGRENVLPQRECHSRILKKRKVSKTLGEGEASGR